MTAKITTTQTRPEHYARLQERLIGVVDMLKSAEAFSRNGMPANEHRHVCSSWHILQQVKFSLELTQEWLAKENNLPVNKDFWHSIEDSCKGL